MALRQHIASHAAQRGAALLIFALLLIIGLLGTFLSQLNSTALSTQRDQITNEALAQAKEALIGYAASAKLTPAGPRPGDLPCPDNHPPGDPLEGTPSTPCSGNALGRLPWKKLGLPDVRDSSGERLWYAVSINFKSSPRTACPLPGQPGCLNSDTNGSITVRDSAGVIVNNGTVSTGAIAVIISPGNVLTREDGTSQVRNAANANNPVHYLDVGNGEDNATFADSDTNGFINGDVRDAANNTIVNDRILAITSDNLMPTLGKRVAGEALTCLTEYAAKPQNQGRYPWAAALNPLAAPSYADTSGNRFGRVPDTFFAATKSDSGNIMDDSWTGNCNINSTSGWWLNWKEHVFYAVADAYKPAVTPPSCGGTGTCLVVNLPATSTNKQVVVFVAGRPLAGQLRASNLNKGTITNYLENQNASLDDVFERSTMTPTFNDTTSFSPPGP